MPEFTLPRTGENQLKFSGELVKAVDGELFAARESNRWWELAVYRLDDGDYVCAASLRTRWQGETAWHAAAVSASPSDWYRALEPVPPGIGFPHRPEYAEKQTALIAAITRQYQSLVSDLLEGDEFAERVDQDPLHNLRQARDLRRYRALLRAELATVELTVPEASLIVDACNGCGQFSIVAPDSPEDAPDSEWLGWRANVEDHIRLNRADQRFEVDGKKLVQYLAGLNQRQSLAVCDAIERWWKLDSRDTVSDSLASVGLVSRIRRPELEKYKVRDLRRVEPDAPVNHYMVFRASDCAYVRCDSSDEAEATAILLNRGKAQESDFDWIPDHRSNS